MSELQLIESGASDMEFWCTKLADITVMLRVPCRTLIAARGERGAQAQFAKEMPTGELILKRRTDLDIDMETMCREVEMSEHAYSVRQGAQSLNEL